MVQGRNLILALNNTAIAAAKSCSIKVQQNFIEACSPTSGRTKKKIPADYSWDLSCDCLMATPAYADSIVDMVKNGTEVTVRFYDTTYGINREGKAFVASATIDGSVGSLSKLSISLTGSEELETYKEEITLYQELYEQFCYEFGEYQGHDAAFVSQNQGYCKVYSFTLTAQTTCEFKLGGAGLVVAGGDRVPDQVDRENTIYLDEDADYWASTNMVQTLPAGTHYVLFSEEGQWTANPKVYKLS